MNRSFLFFLLFSLSACCNCEKKDVDNRDIQNISNSVQTVEKTNEGTNDLDQYRGGE